MTTKKSSIVDETLSGLRLDKYLSHLEEVQTRNRALHLINEGQVTVNGKLAKPSQKVETGDEVAFELPPAQPTGLIPLNLDLDIIFEDRDLLVVNKPAGLVVHPAAGHQQDTLVNALLFHTKDLSMKFGEDRPGIVHRIDKETSGLLVVAKNDFTHEKLAEQFKNKTVHRIYYAAICGRAGLQQGKVQSYLARHPMDRKKYASLLDVNRHIIRKPLSPPPEVGKWAVTIFEIIKSNGLLHYARLKLETGRTHQIRVHLSEMRLPIVGDELYGFSQQVKSLSREQSPLKGDSFSRFFLHAAELGFLHPRTQQFLSFSIGWPLQDQQRLKSWGLL